MNELEWLHKATDKINGLVVGTVFEVKESYLQRSVKDLADIFPQLIKTGKSIIFIVLKMVSVSQIDMLRSNVL